MSDHEDVKKIKKLLTPFVDALDHQSDAGKALVSRLSAVKQRLASVKAPRMSPKISGSNRNP